MEDRASIIIPTLNRYKVLYETVQYFIRYESYSNFEIIIIDQSDSYENAPAWLTTKADKRIKWIPVNYKHLTKARNYGVNLATGEIIIFLDDDAIPQKDYIKAHLSQYGSPEIAGVGGPILEPGEKFQPMPSQNDCNIEKLKKVHNPSFHEADKFITNWICGCNASFRKTWIRKVGNFDEHFYGVSVGEDGDYCIRIAKAGGILIYNPAAYVIHKKEKKGGCRSSVGSAYVYEFAYCMNYYLFKQGVFGFRRLIPMCHEYRNRIFHKKYLLEPIKLIKLTVAFIHGVLKSQKLIRSLSA